MKAQKFLFVLAAVLLAGAGSAWAGGRVYGSVGVYVGPGAYWGPAYPRPYYYPWPYIYGDPFYAPAPVVVVPATPKVYIEQSDVAAGTGGAALLPRASATPGAVSADGVTTTYTLTVAAPLDELLATLARRFGLTLDLDHPALARVGVAPGEIVRLELRDAPRDALLDAITKPRGLTWLIEGGSLSISAAPR